MNKKEFIQGIMKRYQGGFKDEDHAQQWASDYKVALPETIDFDRLNAAMLKRYTFNTLPPAPGWLLDLWAQIKPSHSTYVPPRGADPPTPEFIEFGQKMKALAAQRRL